MGGSDRGRA